MAMVSHSSSTPSHPRSRVARHFLALLAFLLLGAASAKAQNIDVWSGGGNPSWGYGFNWFNATFPGNVPTANDTAVIEYGNLFASGNLVFNAPVINGADPFGGQFSVNALMMGLFTTDQFPYLAINGTGTLTGNSAIIGNITGFETAATVAVSDGGSVWSTNGDVLVGNNTGQGVLYVSSLGLVTASGNIIIGANTTGGSLGIGAVVLNQGILQANGTIVFNNGGGNSIFSVDSTGTFITFVPSGLQGQGTIIGNVTANSVINPNGITIPSGIITFNNNLTLGANASVTLTLGGSNRGTEYSALNIGGNATLNGTLSFTLVSGFTPVVGNTFTLFQYGGNVSGNFTAITTPPFLPGGLGWDLSNISVNGTTTVIPVFTLQPVDAIAVITQNATFTAAAANVTSPTFQWQTSLNNGVTWTNLADGGNFNGTATANLTISNTTAAMNGNLFRATTTNPNASAASNPAKLTVDTTIFWSGNDSTDWTDANNWAPIPIVPSAVITTVIDSAGGNQPVIATNVTITNFTIGLDGNSSANTSLTVQAGGNLTTGNNCYIGYGPTANGNLVLNGSGVNATVGKNLFAGWSGDGNLTVANGANLSIAATCYLGTNEGSNFTANITGANSTVTTAGDLDVGFFGNGTLIIGNGASFILGNLTAASRITVAALGNSTGAIILNNGAIGAANANNTLFNVNGRGSLSGNGSIASATTIAGNFTPANYLAFAQSLSFSSHATVNIALSGPNRGLDYAAVDVAGSLVLGGTLNFTLTNGFIPYAGEVFNIFSSPNPFISNFAKINTVPIPNGLGFDLTQLATNGNITAVTVISNQTTSPKTITETQSTTFFVTAVGTSVKYDWQRSKDSGVTWTDLSAADTHFANFKGATLKLTNGTVDMSGNEFRCIVTNTITSAISTPVTLIVIPQFDVTTEPATQSVVAGSTVVFSFAVTSPRPLTYQWYKNGKIMVGQTSSNLTLFAVTKSNNATYTVVATSDIGGTQGSTLAKLTVVKVPPRIVTQPRSLTTTTGRTATFRSFGNGDQTLTFQWQISTNGGLSYTKLVNGAGPGGSVLSGATASGINNSALVITGANPLNDGIYRLKVTNAAGLAVSKGATLTVN